jgi:hypothetical protein
MRLLVYIDCNANIHKNFEWVQFDGDRIINSERAKVARNTIFQPLSKRLKKIEMRKERISDATAIINLPTIQHR